MNCSNYWLPESKRIQVIFSTMATVRDLRPIIVHLRLYEKNTKCKRDDDDGSGKVFIKLNLIILSKP